MDFWEVLEEGYGISTEKKGGVTRNQRTLYSFQEIWLYF